MLFWLFVIILAIGIAMSVLGNLDWYELKKNWKDKKRIYEFGQFMYNHDAKFSDAGLWTNLISGTIVSIMAIILCCSYCDMDAKVEKYNEHFNALEYKVTSGACRDEFGLLSKSVIDEVQDWNEDVVYYQTVQDDFWIGIFYPNVFDQFKTIDYESYNSKNQEFIYGEME